MLSIDTSPLPLQKNASPPAGGRRWPPVDPPAVAFVVSDDVEDDKVGGGSETGSTSIQVDVTGEIEGRKIGVWFLAFCPPWLKFKVIHVLLL